MSVQAHCSEEGGPSDANNILWGRYFIEGMLTFEEMNSPSIYNLPASYLILLAHRDSGLDTRQSIQQLGRYPLA